MDLISIANQFRVESEICSAISYGCGHINDTYKLEDKNGKNYILQRINNNIFKDVDALMSNIVGVTNYIAKKSSSDDLLQVIYTIDDMPYFKCDDGYFRMYNFISSGISIESRATKEQFKLSAKGFGKFQKSLDGYDTTKLVDTIPNFHNTVWRYNQFLQAIDNDFSGRKDNVKQEIEWYISRKHYCNKILSLLENGDIPYRVTHNDTKLNNVLINVFNNKAVCVIDLDTVMKGAICYDFGDSIRFGANIGAEDESDLSKVGFDMDLYTSFADGFIEEVGDRLTKNEVETLYFGAILMTYECGMRFLTDYLNGDTYFKTKYPDHNLVRTLTQMKMVEDMESCQDKMQSIVVDLYAKSRQ